MRFGGLQHHLGAACFWRSFRPSVAWCFGVAKGAFWRLAASPLAAPPAAAAGAAAAAGPASSCNRFVLNRIQKGRQAFGQHVFWRSFRPSVAWCFGVAKGAFWRLAAPAPAAPLAAAAGAAAAAGPAAELALFLPESKRDVKPPGSMFLEVVPSFSSMVFRCGEECVLEACSTTSSSTNSSSSRSSSSSRPSSCNRFVLNRIQKGRQASGQHVFWRSFRPSVAWCFGVAKGAFWRLAAPAPAAPLAAAAGAAAAAGPAAAIALFLTESRRIQKGRQASGQHVFRGRSVLQ